jgi:hypothetical protein
MGPNFVPARSSSRGTGNEGHFAETPLTGDQRLLLSFGGKEPTRGLAMLRSMQVATRLVAVFGGCAVVAAS